MKLRVFLASAIVSMWAGCQCGPAALCDSVKCGSGLVCVPATGKCAVAGAGQTGSDGGATGGGMGGGTGSMQPGDAGPQCPVTCGVDAPVCDPVAQKCVVCTATAGCSAPTAFCDTKVAPSGACYGCRTFADCEGERVDCDTSTHTCYRYDAGYGGGSGGSPVSFDDAGLTAHCQDVTGSAPTCKGESCPKGYACANGACVLNGRNGPVQVTLRWDRDEDLDLYLVAPKKVGGGPCEIYYSQPNAPPVTIGGYTFPTVGCGAQAYLDRDSNPACKIDHVNVENIVTPTGEVALSGKYTVRANYYQNCSATSPTPYEVEVRANGQTRYYCGKFNPNAANGGSAGAGVVITEFTIQ